MAEKVVIDVEIKDGNAKKSLDALTKSNTDLAASFEDVYGEMQPLSGRMGELEDRLYELALAGKQNTQEYKDLQSEVAKFKRVIAETDMAVDGASGTMSQKLSGAIGGVTSAFELGQGVMAAFGVESGEVEAALLKVQSAMAISQGLQGLKEAVPAFTALKNVAVDAFKGIRAGVAATGIGLLLVAVGTLVAYWDDVIKALGVVSEEEKKLAEFRRKHDAERRDFVAKESAGFAMALSQLKATNEGSKERSKLISEINQKYGTTLKNLSDEKAFQQQINDELKNYLAYQTAKFKLQANEDAIVQNLKTQSKLKQQLAEDERKLTELQSKGALKRKEGYEIDDMGRRISTGQTYANEQLAIEYQNTNKRIKENEDALKSAEKRFENYGKAALRAGSEISKLTDNGKKYVEQNKEVVKATEESTQAIQERSLTEEEIEQLRYDELGRMVAEEEQKKRDQMMADALLEGQLRTAIFEKELADYEENERLKKEIRERNKQFAIDASISTFQTIADLANAFASKDEAQQKKAFQVQKAASIAKATVETYKAAQSAYASQLIPTDPTSPIRATIAAGIAVATGIANIKQIASTQFNSNSSPASSGGGAGGGMGTQSTPANFNIVGNAGANPLAGLNQPIQAYVVSGQITSAQELDRNKITYSSFP